MLNGYQQHFREIKNKLFIKNEDWYISRSQAID